MVFTNNCDLYGAIHPEGINLLVQHIERQSLYNYGIEDTANDPEIRCSIVDHAEDAEKHDSPILMVENYLTRIGIDSPISVVCRFIWEQVFPTFTLNSPVGGME